MSMSRRIHTLLAVVSTFIAVALVSVRAAVASVPPPDPNGSPASGNNAVIVPSAPKPSHTDLSLPILMWTGLVIVAAVAGVYLYVHRRSTAMPAA